MAPVTIIEDDGDQIILSGPSTVINANVTISTSAPDPDEGEEGDLWFQVAE